MKNKLNGSKVIYITLGTTCFILLGILIWQLVTLNFYNKLSFYFGTLVILGYHGLLYSSLSMTRHLMHKRAIMIFRWFVGILMIIGILLMIEFSNAFNVPPILFYLNYFLLLFLVGIIFTAFGLLTTTKS